MWQSYRAFSGSFARYGRPRGASIDVPSMQSRELGLRFGLCLRLEQEAINEAVVHKRPSVYLCSQAAGQDVQGGSFAELGLHRPKGLHTLPTAQGEKSRFSNTSVDILSIYKSDNISRSRKPRSLKTCSIEKNCIDKIVDVQYRKWFSINRSSKLLDTIFGISRSHFSNCCRH